MIRNKGKTKKIIRQPDMKSYYLFSIEQIDNHEFIDCKFNTINEMLAFIHGYLHAKDFFNRNR